LVGKNMRDIKDVGLGMKSNKLLIIFFVLCVGFLVDCTMVSGTYVGADAASMSDVRGKLLGSRVIPINNKLLFCHDPAISSDSDPYYYRVGPSDAISIAVWNHPELTLTGNSQATSDVSLTNSVQKSSSTLGVASGALVEGDGAIFFPLLGRVKVVDMTTDQIREKLTSRLMEYVRHPQVSVQVTAFNSRTFNVMGEVSQPGVRVLTNKPVSIMDALNYAGGDSPNTADVGHVYVFRGGINDVKVYWLDARSPSALILAQHFRIAANDIVYVPPVGLTTWDRVINQILPTVQTVWFMHSMTMHWNN
jgi:protein involved in polysaccharide export with SLBB domain